MYPYDRLDLKATPATSFYNHPTCTADDLGSIRPSIWNEPTRHSTFTITVGLGLVVIAMCLMLLIRYQSRTETVFQSAARNEESIQVTQHYPGGPETESLSGPLELSWSIPPTGETINKVRRRLVHNIHAKEAAIKSKISLRPATASSSSSTLLGDRLWPKASEHHDGLIELKRKNGTRNFLVPETGETLHLSPWKSRKESRDDEDEDGELDRGDVSRVITQMGVGSAVFGGGAAAERALHEQAQAEPNQHPRQMGDTLASLLTNEPASVGDALKGTVFEICI